MRIVFLSALFIVFSAFRMAPSEEVQTEVVVSNIKNPKGTLIISFYNNAADFPKVGKDIYTARVTVTDINDHSVKVKLPAEGWYAIAMYQDEDGKDKIKQDKIGIPMEPYGFSNNVHPRVEAPGFASCKFYVGKDNNQPVTIKLIQPKFQGKM